MRILSLTSSYPRYEGDPTAPFIESITQHVAARGHEIDLVLPEHRLWSRPAEEGRIRYHPYRYSPSRRWTPWGYSASLASGVRIRRPLYALAPVVLLAAWRACEAVASRASVDVVHVHWVVPNGPVGARVARRHEIPLVVSLHGSDVSVAERSGALRGVVRRTLSGSAAVTAPTTDLLERARALGADGRLELIPYGVDATTFKPDAGKRAATRARLGFEDDELVVLAVGRFVHVKGFAYLIDAMAQLRANAPHARLLLVGDGDLAGDLRTQARALPVDVVFAGVASRDEIPAYYSASDVVAVPSVRHDGYVDGLPNVAIEAMAAGKPLVATRVGGLPELVEHGHTGLLVEERDASGLAEAILSLAGDGDLRARMGRAGREHVAAARSWDVVAAQLSDVFEAVSKR